MSSTWGEKIRISIFGGSHTRAIGVNIEGLPAGEPICWEQVLGQMARRAPGQDPTATTRKEADTPQVLCGLLDGVTTGAPLCAIIENTNQRSKDYSSLRVLPRPGHADYTAYVKYGNHHDVRGGGHFSGRLTAPLVFAGAIARQLLQRRGILVASHVASIGEAQDQPFDPVSIPPQLLERLAGEYFPVIDAARANLHPCTGCVRCGYEGPCVQKDDMERFRREILDADMMVFVTPLYYYGMSAQLKTLIDRFCAINASIQGKQMQAALLTVAWNADTWTFEALEAHYNTLLRYLNLTDRGRVLGYGCGTPGMTRRSPYLQKAYELGRSL